jgi:Lon protease-like protein
MSQQREIPLFPLNTVLFPGMSLPLHIFEERYKHMITECVDQSKPFGVVLIRTGNEVGPGATIHEVGTTAHITHVDRLPDERLNINTVGYKRFKVLDVQFNQPYLVGVVEDFPLLNTDAPLIKPTALRMTGVLQNYLNIFAKLGNVDLELDQLPDDPTTLAFLAAIILRTPMRDKQDLLSQADLLELLRCEHRILHRESQIMNLLMEQGQRWKDDDSVFSLN